MLSDAAIMALKEELYKSNVKPVLEEFIPLKKNSDDDDNDDDEDEDRGGTRKEDCIDKKNWMSSVQLWNASDNPSSKTDFTSRTSSKSDIKKVL